MILPLKTATLFCCFMLLCLVSYAAVNKQKIEYYNLFTPVKNT